MSFIGMFWKSLRPVRGCAGNDLRLSLVPVLLAYIPHLLEKDKGAILVAYRDVGQAVAIDIAHPYLFAHSRVVVDQMGYVLDGPVGMAHELEPVEQRRSIGLRVRAVAPLGPLPLARDDVLEAVAIHVGQVERMQFGEGN